MIPQIIITLSPEGFPQAELPGANGLRRVIALSPQHCWESLRMILLGQQRQQTSGKRELLDWDGAPSQNWLTHLEKHQEWPSDTCPHCKAEGRTLHTSKRKRRVEVLLKREGVEVRRVPSKQKGRKQADPRSAQELGL